MTPEQAKKAIGELTEKINHHNYLYYQKNTSEIPDFEFDKLLEKLIALENEFPQLRDPHSPSQRVGGAITKEFPTVRHRYPMLSLGNTYSPAELEEFVRCSALVGAGDENGHVVGANIHERTVFPRPRT